MSALPGIEFKQSRAQSNRIHLKERPVGGFVGITRKGPINEAVHLRDFNQFLRVFGGFDTSGYLPFSVYSFFQNGGKECYVVRTAHTQGKGAASESSLAIAGKDGNTAALLRSLSSGTWGNLICANLWFTPAGPSSKKMRANLSVGIPGLQEDFLDLSLNREDEDFIVRKVNSRSALVKLESYGIEEGVLPAELNNVYFSGGRDGLSALTPGDIIGTDKGPSRKTGLAILEAIPEVNLLAVPDTAVFMDSCGNDTDRALNKIRPVHEALISQAERLEGRFALLDMTGALNTEEVISYRNSLDSSRAALYYPSLKILDPVDNGIFSLPPSCAMAGIISKMDLDSGCFHPPGNSFIHGAVGLSRSLSSADMEELYERGINPFKKIPGQGVKIWGVRTISSDPEWRFINVRRTVSFLSAAVRRGTAWAVFEPNDKNLQKKLVRHVTSYLIDVWRKGYLAGKTANEAFYVRCDEELNPPENVDAGILTLQIGLCVVKPAEYIVVTMNAEQEHTNVIIDEEGIS